MSYDLLEDLKTFLSEANLSNYEINVYISLLTASKSNPPTAREISKDSGVPSGRIYEVLEELNLKGFIDIIDARPKKFTAINLNKALENLINFHKKENRRKMSFLYERAKKIEHDLYKSEIQIRKEPSKIFWSTKFGTKSILTLYAKYINEAKEEIIFNEFINRSTLKIIPHASLIYTPLKEAVDRGVKVRDLWSFEYDNRPLNEEQKTKCKSVFEELRYLQDHLYGLSVELPNFNMKYTYHFMSFNFDIIDKKRILFKLKNPLKPYQIFTCMNVVDPKLADKLRDKFLSVWTFEALDLS
jgi:sugar-specific transcriptional regulator TrmB